MAIDILGIQPNVISRDIRNKFILLAGPPKIGKTEFISQAPDVLILATEIGTNARPGTMVQPINKYSDFKLVLRQLESEEAKSKYLTIGIDTIGILYDLCEQYVCAQNSVQKIFDVPYGGGYTQLSKEFESSLRKITMLGYGLLMSCHLKEINDDDGKTIGYKPDLNNRCLKIVNGLVDVIAVITQGWTEQGESRRWLLTRATPTITAGSRYKHLDAKIPFGYDHFIEALGRAIDAEAADGATVVDKLDKVVEKSRTFEEINAEAKEIFMKLVAIDTENAKKILKKVEIIFDRPLRLSEITEDQSDLYELVVLDMKEMLAAL